MKRKSRCGMAVPEWFCILGFGSIVLFAFFGLTGESVEEGIETKLNSEFGVLGKQAKAATGTAASGRTTANNGVGNGEDDQPPGDPPINDGEGTAPGSPGNQGGV